MKDAELRLACVLAPLFTIVPVLQPRVDADLPSPQDDHYAGLQ